MGHFRMKMDVGFPGSFVGLKVTKVNRSLFHPVSGVFAPFFMPLPVALR